MPRRTIISRFGLTARSCGSGKRLAADGRSGGSRRPGVYPSIMPGAGATGSEVSGSMRFLDFTTVTPREVAPGYLGRYLHSDHITQGRVDIAPGAVIAEHSHP